MTTGEMRASGDRVPTEGWRPVESLLVRLSFNLLVLVAEHRFHAPSEDRAAALTRAELAARTGVSEKMI